MAIAQRIDVPSLPNASVRRGKPAPFSRPSISIGGGTAAPEKREWQHILACHLAEGDIVPGIGRLFAVTENMDIALRTWTITVQGGVDNVRTFQGNEEVLAFTTRAVA